MRTPAPTEESIKHDNLQNVHIVQGDLADFASLNAATAHVSAITDGVVDHLILNGAHLSAEAYFLQPSDIIGREAFFLEELNKSMTTNAAGTLFAINAFIPLVLKSSIKKVVAISSAAGDIGATVQADVTDAITYGMSKAALNLLIAKFAIAYKEQEVVFLALNPGFVYTFTDTLESSKC